MKVFIFNKRKNNNYYGKAGKIIMGGSLSLATYSFLEQEIMVDVKHLTWNIFINSIFGLSNLK